LPTLLSRNSCDAFLSRDEPVDAGEISAESTIVGPIILHDNTNAGEALQPASYGTVIAHVQPTVGADDLTAEGIPVSGLNWLS
jgi:hypothetical protein